MRSTFSVIKLHQLLTNSNRVFADAQPVIPLYKRQLLVNISKDTRSTESSPINYPLTSTPVRRYQRSKAFTEIETIDTIFRCLGSMNYEKCYQACKYLRQLRSGVSTTDVRYPKPIEFHTCLDELADIFKSYGSRMKILKANFNQMVDKNSILAISRLLPANFTCLQHFCFSGSLYYPDVTMDPAYLPDLSNLRTLKMSDFSRFTDDVVVRYFLKQAQNTLQALTLERMTIDGSCLDHSPDLKSLTLRSLTTLNVRNVNRFLARCRSLISLTIEMPGFAEEQWLSLLPQNMLRVRVLKLKIDNRLPFMETINVLPVIDMTSLTTLELEIFSMKGLNELIQHLAKFNKIERLALCLNDILEADTIKSMFHFNKLRNLKLIVDKIKSLQQLYNILPFLTHDNKLTIFELVVCAFDVTTLCQLIPDVEHLYIHVNGPLEHMYNFTLLSNLKTFDLTMRIYDRFFLYDQHNSTVNMLCKIATMIGIVKLKLTLMTSSLDDQQLEDFRQMALSNNLQMDVIEDVYAIADVTCNLQFDVLANHEMNNTLESMFATVYCYLDVVQYLRLVIETGNEPDELM